MKKVVIAINSFKGSLTSAEANQAAAKAVVRLYPRCNVVQLPVADGGDGSLDAWMTATAGQYVCLTAHDPLMRIISTRYGICGDNQTVFIEMATISGLTLLTPEKRNPIVTTSFGTGELIKDALDKGFRKFIIGIGGSATNDAGLGILQALGYCFYDRNGKELSTGGRIMAEVSRIDVSNIHPALHEASFTIACDVNNPFYGPTGAACIYARQKGADNKMIKLLDKGMQSLAGAIRKFTAIDVQQIPGAGAAGGIGGTLAAFLKAPLKPGIELLLNKSGFDEKIQSADLIITGEGKADRQTMMGKVPYGILQIAVKQQIPVALIAGSIEDKELLIQAGFHTVSPINPPGIPLEKAMEPGFARQQIHQTVIRICDSINNSVTD